ncbi:MAG: calcium/sodium antiporter, partial [Thermoplasmatales archaeon]
IVGIILLWKGSDMLVDGTSKIALQLGVSTLIVSVLLVGFGTSSPEFAISVGSAIQNDPDSAGISLGNIIGSCVANLLLVLGVAAIIKPISIKKSIIKREAPIMLIATIIFLILSFSNLLDEYHFIGGIIFLISFSAFLLYFIKCAKKERENKKGIDSEKLQKNILFIFLGIAGVVMGAWLLIESAVSIADFLGVPALFIALSMVAVGTSLPELVVSSMAVYRNKDDIAIGNVLGSNVFNILLILGVSSLFIPLNAIFSMDHIFILFIITLIIFPILYTGHKISRIEGLFMLLIYSIFIWYVFFGYALLS